MIVVVILIIDLTLGIALYASLGAASINYYVLKFNPSNTSVVNFLDNLPPQLRLIRNLYLDLYLQRRLSLFEAQMRRLFWAVSISGSLFTINFLVLTHYQSLIVQLICVAMMILFVCGLIIFWRLGYSLKDAVTDPKTLVISLVDELPPTDRLWRFNIKDKSHIVALSEDKQSIFIDNHIVKEVASFDAFEPVMDFEIDGQTVTLCIFPNPINLDIDLIINGYSQTTGKRVFIQRKPPFWYNVVIPIVSIILLIYFIYDGVQTSSLSNLPLLAVSLLLMAHGVLCRKIVWNIYLSPTQRLWACMILSIVTFSSVLWFITL